MVLLIHGAVELLKGKWEDLPEEFKVWEGLGLTKYQKADLFEIAQWETY